MKVVNGSGMGSLEQKMINIIQNQLIFHIDDDQFEYGDMDMNEEFEEYNDIQNMSQLGGLTNKLIVKYNILNKKDEENMKLRMLFKQREEGSIWMKDKQDTKV